MPGPILLTENRNRAIFAVLRRDRASRRDIEKARSIPVWGTLNLRVPKLRQGSYFPRFLEARRTPERAMVAVIQEVWRSAASRPGGWMSWFRRWDFAGLSRPDCHALAMR